MRFRLCIALASRHLAAAPRRRGRRRRDDRHKDVPWFASVSGCGGTLVNPTGWSPRRTASAATRPRAGETVVNGQARTVTQVAMHPASATRTGTTPSTTSRSCSSTSRSRASRRSRSASPASTPHRRRGNIFAPAPATARPRCTAALRQATLRQISDADCAKGYRHNTPGTGERFNAARMVRGRRRRQAAAQLGLLRRQRRPADRGTTHDVQLGVVSWGGDSAVRTIRRRCSPTRPTTANSSSTRPRAGARRSTPR